MPRPFPAARRLTVRGLPRRAAERRRHRAAARSLPRDAPAPPARCRDRATHRHCRSGRPVRHETLAPPPRTPPAEDAPIPARSSRRQTPRASARSSAERHEFFRAVMRAVSRVAWARSERGYESFRVLYWHSPRHMRTRVQPTMTERLDRNRTGAGRHRVRTGRVPRVVQNRHGKTARCQMSAEVHRHRLEARPHLLAR